MFSTLSLVILAAGNSARMGKPKLLLDLGGRPVLARVLDSAGGLPWRDKLAVIGEPQEELRAICREFGFLPVFNPQRRLGQATSVAQGVSHLSANVEGVLFLPGDMPFVSRELLAAMADLFAGQKSRKAIIVPSWLGENRSPVIFGSYWLPHLKALSGDRGGSQIIREHSEAVIFLPWEDNRVFLDIDTALDYELACQEWKRQGHAELCEY